MSTFVPPASPGRWHAVRQAAGRVPLRIKLITAVLALVIIALVVISVASINLFRDYQLNRASQQATTLFNQQLAQIERGGGVKPNMPIYAGSFLIDMRPAGFTLRVSPAGYSIPDIPTSPAWLAANSGKLVNVPAVSGADEWQVITKQVPDLDPFTGQPTGQQNTLIVGVDLGDINGMAGQLAYIDLVVGGIVVAALAMAGIAIVRTSLRPLKDIEVTAAAIAAGDLSRRVPEHDPRTEVGRLGRALNMMLAQIESAFHARERSEAAARRSEEKMRQFVADASHELRTPLTAIRGFAEYYRQRGGIGNGTAAPISQAAGADATGPTANARNVATASETGNGADAAPTPEPANAAETTSRSEATSVPTRTGTGQLASTDMDRIMRRVEQESARMGVLVEDMLLLARLDQQRPLDSRPVDLLTLA